MRNQFLLIFFMFAIPACNSKIDKTNYINSKTELDGKKIYFPMESLSDSYINKYLSKPLSLLYEPQLFSTIVSHEVYRLAVLNPKQKPVIFRIEKTDTAVNLSWKVCTGMDTLYRHYKVEKYYYVVKKKKLSFEDWDKCQELISDIDFWDKENAQIPDTTKNIDILEGSDREHYSFYYDSENNSLMELKKYLVSLSDLTYSDCLGCNYLQNKNRYVTDTILTDSLNVPGHNADPFITNKYHQREYIGTLYFPVDFFSRTEFDEKESKEMRNFMYTWYSEGLYMLKEPLLYNKINDREIYRFSLIQSFSSPIAIRIEKEAEHFRLCWRSKVYGTYELLFYEKEISINDWNHFKALIDKTDFWNMQTIRYIEGEDGAAWLLEGTVNDKYHVVDRWTPLSGNYFDCCSYLIELAGINLKDPRYFKTID